MATKTLDLFAQIKEGYEKALNNAGVPVRFAPSDIRAAREHIADNPANTHDGYGFVPKSDYGDILAVAAYRVSNIADKADKAIHDMSVMLAVTDSYEVWKHVTSPNGKPYKTFANFARDALPNLSESAVRNYVAVARDVYIPIGKGSYKELSYLKDAPVATLAMVKSGITDDDVRPEFTKLLDNIRSRKLDRAITSWEAKDESIRGPAPVIDDIVLTAREMQSALKEAKSAVHGSKSEPAPKVNAEQASSDLAGAGDKPVGVSATAETEDVTAALVKRVKSLFEGDDAVITAMKNEVEFHITADADGKRRILDTLSKAAINGPAAMEFCNCLLKIFK